MVDGDGPWLGGQLQKHQIAQVVEQGELGAAELTRAGVDQAQRAQAGAVLEDQGEPA